MSFKFRHIVIFPGRAKSETSARISHVRRSNMKPVTCCISFLWRPAKEKSRYLRSSATKRLFCKQSANSPTGLSNRRFPNAIGRFRYSDKHVPFRKSFACEVCLSFGSGISQGIEHSPLITTKILPKMETRLLVPSSLSFGLSRQSSYACGLARALPKRLWLDSGTRATLF